MTKQLTLEQLQSLVKGKKFIKPLSKGGYSSNKKGWRRIGGKRYYFKSLWEMNFARFLEHQKNCGEIHDWLYEPRIFNFSKKKYKHKPHAYVPDFKVFLNKKEWVWFEVKGYMNYKSKEKLKRFYENYPNETLEVVGADWFKHARRGLHKTIPGWESL